jgi:C1A family cysteine protease
MSLDIKKIILLSGLGFGAFAYYYKYLKANWGWIPDLPDIRDYLFSPSVPGAGIAATVDLSPKCSPVEFQGNLGSCTAQAVVGALEYLENVASGKFIDLSRLFVYYNERMIENTVDRDAGAQLRDGIKVLKNYGVPPEEEWPYIISQFKNKPPDGVYSIAGQHKITSYERITTFKDMKQCLNEGFPFVFGFLTYENFKSPEVARTGILDMPKSGEKPSGGHAVLAVGYDEKTQRFLIRNSYGPLWGIKGYFWMPYAYLQDENLSSDFWVIRKDV